MAMTHHRNVDALCTSLHLHLLSVATIRCGLDLFPGGNNPENDGTLVLLLILGRGDNCQLGRSGQVERSVGIGRVVDNQVGLFPPVYQKPCALRIDGPLCRGFVDATIRGQQSTRRQKTDETRPQTEKGWPVERSTSAGKKIRQNFFILVPP